jgi:hypothetical protein
MQITNYYEQPSTGSVIAIFEAYSPKMKCHFRNLKLVRSKKGNYFVSFPAQGKDTSEGKKYIHHYEFEGELQKKFHQEILDALAPYLSQLK